MPVVFYVFGFYFLMSLVLTYPLVISLGSAVSDPVDPILNTWIMAWEHHALLTQPLQMWNANIFYPYTRSLLYSETMLIPSFTLFPVSVAIGNPILTHNLLVLLGFTATGTSGYLMGRYLFRSHWSGLVLGSVLAFNSFSLSNVAQAQLLHLEWLPLALIYLGKLLERPRLRFGLLFAFFLAAQFYTVIYYGLFGFVIVGIVGGGGWLLKEFPARGLRWRALGMLVGSTLFALMLCLPLGLAYYNLSQERGLARTLADAWPFSASLEMWMTAPPHNLLYGGLIGNELPTLGFYSLDALFPGLFLLVVAASGLSLWFLDSSAIGKRSALHGIGGGALRYPLFLLLGIAFFFVLSLGPFPQMQSLQPNFDQRLPYAWVHEWVPGFQALRAPGRFAVMVFLGLGVASAYLVTRLRWRALQVSVLVLILVEALSVPTDALYVPTIDAHRRTAYEWLAAQPETVYLEMPVYRFGEGEADRWLESQFGSILHWQKTPVGYSGFFPAHHSDLLLFVSHFPAESVVTFLRALGVEWVLLYPARYSLEEWQSIQSGIGEQGLETRQWGDVWGVHLSSLQAELPKQTYFIPDQAQLRGRLSVAAIFTSDRPTPILPNSLLGDISAEWWNGDGRVLVSKKSYQPPFFVDPVAVATVPIAVPPVEGSYTLQLYSQLYSSRQEQLLATAEVTVMADAAAPEVTLLPVQGVSAGVVCEEGEAHLEVILRTIGWYERPFTLSARILDGSDTEVARSRADVEFVAQRPRTDLLTSHAYKLPLAEVPAPEHGALTVDLIAYQWQQEAERTVARAFVTADGSVVNTLQLPLARSSGCE
ncbi:MAG: hypothetical protein IT328_15570 [Caldilineaceae bacterium]|nr:hypothetical protein [Caldilineaceae bacterium]